MKKQKNIEMKIYELLGIKIFRKMVFALRDKTYTLLTPKMTKEERQKELYHASNNYNIGKVNSLEDLEKFKKQLFFNGGVHFLANIYLVPNVISIISGTAGLPTILITTICGIINSYCIMLQRYNYIRINQTIERMRPHYEKQKEKFKEKLEDTDYLLKEHTYKIINKKDKETDMSIEEWLDNATIEQLKNYRRNLIYLKITENKEDMFPNSRDENISFELEKNKILKIELKK